MAKKRVCILGATGSIGTQAVDVCMQHSGDFEVVGMTANVQRNELLALANKTQCKYVKLVREIDICEFIESCEPDICVNAIVGSAGLKASYHVLKNCKNTRLALANKESLVMAGDILMPLSKDFGRLMPIDSEHGAIFQCLVGENHSEVKNLWITASGGPFRGYALDELKEVKASDALKHPTWNMGAKISIDSATLMNKGLEVIEAHHLFSVDYDHIFVVVHPQSVIHSAVELKDGSFLAHMGKTDMRIPIQYALSYPKRLTSPVESIDLRNLSDLSFETPDTSVFKCLELAYQAGKIGSSATCAINGVNEVMNEAYRHGNCGFLDIQACIEACMNEKFIHDKIYSLDDVLEIDLRAKEFAKKYLKLHA